MCYRSFYYIAMKRAKFVDRFDPLYPLRENSNVTNKELQALKERYVAAGAASPNEQFADHATNAEIWDADGKRMIDFAGGIGV